MQEEYVVIGNYLSKNGSKSSTLAKIIYYEIKDKNGPGNSGTGYRISTEKNDFIKQKGHLEIGKRYSVEISMKPAEAENTENTKVQSLNINKSN